MVPHELTINYSMALEISGKKPKNDKEGENARYYGKGWREAGGTEGGRRDRGGPEGVRSRAHENEGNQVRQAQQAGVQS